MRSFLFASKEVRKINKNIILKEILQEKAKEVSEAKSTETKEQNFDKRSIAEWLADKIKK